MRCWYLAALMAASLVAAGCGDDNVCAPGAVQSCPCAGGGSGTVSPETGYHTGCK